MTDMTTSIGLAVMAGSVVLNFVTNAKNSKKQLELQAKQKEFQKAQADHDFQRMRELQKKSAQLNKEIEMEMHAQRLEEIKNNYDDIIGQIAKDRTLRNWPITMLPFVMKGERFGSFISSGIQTISMHCILTPSNDKVFNDLFYRDLDFQIQAYINDKWYSYSTHPIMYHGGGWKNTGVVDLNQIDQLKVYLKAVPTMVITPYFSADTNELFFRIVLWGMGKDCEGQLYPQTDDENKKIFSYDYILGKLPPENADKKDFIETTLEEFVPYIVSLIGFIADKYYWTMYHVPAFLPLIFHKMIDTGNGIFVKRLESYISTAYSIDCTNTIKSFNSFEHIPTTVDYIETIKPLLSDENYEAIERQMLDLSISMVTDKLHNEFNSLCDVKKYWIKRIDDLPKLGLAEFKDFVFAQENVIKEDSLDLAEAIEKFQSETSCFIGSYDFGLYLEQKAFQCFNLFMYNKDEQKIYIGNNAYHRCYNCNSTKHIKNVMSIFNHKPHAAIYCSVEKLEKLIQRINKQDILIF